MFNATKLLTASKSGKQLPNYYRSEGFTMLLGQLVTSGVPEVDILRTVRGARAQTLLHPVFLVDFTRWLGDPDLYFKTCTRAIAKQIEDPCSTP